MAPPNSAREKVITAYKPSSFIEPFSQEGAGCDAEMTPLAEHTKLEKWTEDGTPYLEEYHGSGKLHDKKAIITGGDSGIGRSVAVFYAREGADVTIAYLPEEEKDARDTQALVEKSGRKCVLVPTDLRVEENCKAVVDRHVSELGRLDILVNNHAKQIQCKWVQDMQAENIQDSLQTNVISFFYMTKHAIPHMKRGSSIINSSSVVGFKGSFGMLDYSAGKAGIVGFTKSLAGQQAPNGIRANVVAPGACYTPLQPASRTAEQMHNWGLGEIPLRGRVAQPAEMGGMYVFLASAESNFASGATFHLNGAQTMT